MSDEGGRGGVRISDPQVMRALAHPARIAIVEYLNNSGAAVTATECAELVGLSPSATSYHLRELAKFGLVEQAPSRGDGRERVWRSVGTGLRIDAEADTPEVADASAALIDLYLERDVAKAREYVKRQHSEPAEWRDAGALMGHQLTLTADELKALNAKVSELVEPYRTANRQDAAPAGSRPINFMYLAFPEDNRG